MFVKGGGQGLNLELAGTPKLLGSLKSEWCPKAYVVTFKLETGKHYFLYIFVLTLSFRYFDAGSKS
jgi:hypothetical protein